MQSVYLKKNEDRRIKDGHIWAYSNEIDTKRSPLAALSPGEDVQLRRSDGQILGSGTVNLHSLIAFRLHSTLPDVKLEQLLEARLNQALALRESLFSDPYYRLVNAEGDGLPGLIIDRYKDFAVIQLNAAGVDALKNPILDWLGKQGMENVYIRNVSTAREREGLPVYTEERGDVLEKAIVWENDRRYFFSVKAGQKTGWFYDQRSNRARARALIREGDVLDLFSYAGGFGLLLADQANVTCVDSSVPAIEHARMSAREQGLDLDFVVADVSEYLTSEGPLFDHVILDPPALIKRKKDFNSGYRKYVALNSQALKRLRVGGLFFSASCSSSLSAYDLRRVLLEAAGRSKSQVQILEAGAAGPDHPTHPALLETAYLKGYWCRKISA
ncbi:MAG: class I SAM-dependent rRNA methyltransferase [Spirochaetales bacterium]|nr:class I SAM-dependent rRNA methyltransferase [Spirochaetales bacterium]